MTKEQIDKMFKKIWEADYINDEMYGREHQLALFTAVINLLMPIIEKQQKCIEFYASEIYSSDADSSPDVYDTIGGDDLEKFTREDGYEYLEAGKLARQTLLEIEAALKEMEK